MDMLTIFFPAYNEEAYIRRAVGAAREVGDHMVKMSEIGAYEILIVDDASNDDTPRIADELAGGGSSIRCVHHRQNRGLGGALKSGFAHARGSVIVYSDIDLPFDMMEITKACRLLRYFEADIITAYRFDRTSEGPRRYIYSMVYNTLIRLLFGLRVRDVNCPFKVVKRSVFEHVVLKSEGSFIDAELMVKADRFGFHIIQFGSDYFHRSFGVSTLSSWSVIFKILREMKQLRKEIRSIRPIS